MIKKFGMVAVGATAGLLVAAPLASATESAGAHHEDSGGGSSCEFTGGNGAATNDGAAEGPIAAAGAIGGLGGSNLLNIADCSDFLNDNLNGNTVGADNTVGGVEIPSLPAVPVPDADDIAQVPNPGLSTPGVDGVTAP